MPVLFPKGARMREREKEREEHLNVQYSLVKIRSLFSFCFYLIMGTVKRFVAVVCELA